VARLSPDQLRRRDQFEGLIRLMEPMLNAVLAAGERLSRVVEREDHDYFPPHSPNLPLPSAPDGSREETRAVTSGGADTGGGSRS
jgi:hypothetical protein